MNKISSSKISYLKTYRIRDYKEDVDPAWKNAFNFYIEKVVNKNKGYICYPEIKHGCPQCRSVVIDFLTNYKES